LSGDYATFESNAIAVGLSSNSPNGSDQRPRASITSPGSLEREVMGLIASPPSWAP